MWLYLSGSDGLPPIVLYEYQAGRSGDFPKAFLDGFSGITQCNGYSGYNKIEDVILAVCSAHCRRKFYEALPAERQKQLKLLDINSETKVKDVSLPDPEQMKMLLYMPDHKDDPAAVETLLPWSGFIKEHCTGLIDVETITPKNKPQLPL